MSLAHTVTDSVRVSEYVTPMPSRVKPSTCSSCGPSASRSRISCVCSSHRADPRLVLTGGIQLQQRCILETGRRRPVGEHTVPVLVVSHRVPDAARREHGPLGL